MSIYVLVIYTAITGQLSSVQGFANKSICESAGKEIVAFTNDELAKKTFICIKQVPK